MAESVPTSVSLLSSQADGATESIVCDDSSRWTNFTVTQKSLKGVKKARYSLVVISGLGWVDIYGAVEARPHTRPRSKIDLPIYPR